MAMKFYAEPVDALHFDEDGNGPFPILGGGSVQAARFDPEDPSDNYPRTYIHIRTRPFGGWAMTPEGARSLAAELVRAADEADAALEAVKP